MVVRRRRYICSEQQSLELQRPCAIKWIGTDWNPSQIKNLSKILWPGRYVMYQTPHECFQTLRTDIEKRGAAEFFNESSRCLET